MFPWSTHFQSILPNFICSRFSFLERWKQNFHLHWTGFSSRRISRHICAISRQIPLPNQILYKNSMVVLVHINVQVSLALLCPFCQFGQETCFSSLQNRGLNCMIHVWGHRYRWLKVHLRRDLDVTVKVRVTFKTQKHKNEEKEKGRHQTISPQ